MISLDNFALSDLKNGDLQRVSDRFEREGMIVQITEAPHADSLLRELRTISDEWLNGRAEKGYSLGWFKVEYLQRAPIVVLRNTKGTILAFASIAPGYDQGLTLSVDLLRQRKNVPNGTVDYLLVCMLEWAKSKGYRRFNLGNTPLSSSGGQDPGALKEEKLAHQVFNRGGHGHGYGFARLRRYKEKFNPEWEPRYLAYPASLTLPVLTLDLVRLVSRHPEHKANN
ncbi:Phosphatidylglycerol lysyltransferase [compost metagenome]